MVNKAAKDARQQGTAHNVPLFLLGLTDKALVEEATSYGTWRREYAF